METAAAESETGVEEAPADTLVVAEGVGRHGDIDADHVLPGFCHTRCVRGPPRYPVPKTVHRMIDR